MIGCKQMGYLKKLSNCTKLSTHVLEVNKPQTNAPMPHVMHKNPIVPHP